MNTSPREALSRLTDRRLSRRALIGVAAVTLVPTLSRTAAGQAPSDASALVQRFYELVNAYQYAEAYDLLGEKWQGQQSEQRFTNGYWNTAFVQCMTTGETTSNGMVTVGVELVSWHNDDKIVAYRGHYTVGNEGGTLKILAGDNTPVDPPRGVPPLATLNDITLAFGPWQGAAGSREGSIVATNEGGRTVALGGSPRVTLVDSAGNTLRSTSEAGTPPMAVILAPGEQAYAPLRFSNWCGNTDNPRSVSVEVPGDTGTATVSSVSNGISYPPCNGAGQPATMSIKGWTSGLA